MVKGNYASEHVSFSGEGMLGYLPPDSSETGKHSDKSEESLSLHAQISLVTAIGAPVTQLSASFL